MSEVISWSQFRPLAVEGCSFSALYLYSSTVTKHKCLPNAVPLNNVCSLVFYHGFMLALDMVHWRREPDIVSFASSPRSDSRLTAAYRDAKPDSPSWLPKTSSMLSQAQKTACTVVPRHVPKRTGPPASRHNCSDTTPKEQEHLL